MKTISKVLVAAAIALLPLYSCEKHYADGYDDDTEKISHEEESDYEWDDSTIVEITLNGTSIDVVPAVATVSGTSVTITDAGVYRISGNLDDGQIIVNTTDEEAVRLILNGVEIYCSASAPIFVEKASKTVVKLEEGTENRLTDGQTYTTNSDGEPGATLFSNSNLTLFGEGTLTIEANYNDAISCDDGLIIKSGTYNIEAVDDGIRGKDYVIIDDGVFVVNVGGDGLHADANLTVNGGDITVAKSYEGLEGATIVVNAGTIHVISSDDGLNTAGGNDGSGTGGGQTGPGAGYQSTGNYNCTINGGYIFINATGDGIDINGSITMADGTLIVSGPTSSGNGAIDFDGTFTVTGGTIIAAGSGGMEQGISTSSSQYAVYAFFNTYQTANTLVSLWTTDGEELITYANPKKFGFVIFVAPELKKGSSYQLYYSGSSTGTVKDGVYTDGDYTPGTKFGECTISSILTKIQ